MKRMIDNKKLEEIESSGGTQWYQHDITFKGGDILKLVTIRQDAIKDGGWPMEHFPIIVVDYGGPDSFEYKYSFPLLIKNASTSLQISYVGSSNERATYTFSEKNIISEKVTAL